MICIHICGNGSPKLLPLNGFFSVGNSFQSFLTKKKAHFYWHIFYSIYPLGHQPYIGDNLYKIQCCVNLSFQYTYIICRRCAPSIELCQQLLLVGHRSIAGGAGHIQGDCIHRQVLADRLGMAIRVKNA